MKRIRVALALLILAALGNVAAPAAPAAPSLAASRGERGLTISLEARAVAGQLRSAMPTAPTLTSVSSIGIGVIAVAGLTVAASIPMARYSGFWWLRARAPTALRASLTALPYAVAATAAGARGDDDNGLRPPSQQGGSAVAPRVPADQDSACARPWPDDGRGSTSNRWPLHVLLPWLVRYHAHGIRAGPRQRSGAAR